ncbi:hypothetical protein LWI29_036961 [Acer saccharum]|uniref:Uncharacterized protein n=1 Tax=Acer saccharum TaxID=4024 RepID=A0AA39W1I3_ACESA|nr:hypothetical protein LWI29_036961 [Acer saccharum]
METTIVYKKSHRVSDSSFSKQQQQYSQLKLRILIRFFRNQEKGPWPPQSNKIGSSDRQNKRFADRRACDREPGDVVIWLSQTEEFQRHTWVWREFAEGSGQDATAKGGGEG